MANLIKYSQVSYYVELYQYILKKTNGSEITQEFIDDEIFPKMGKLLKHDEISILSLGAGTGSPDQLLLESLDRYASTSQRFIHVSYTVVEPLEGFMNIVKRDFTSLSQELKNVKISPVFKMCKAQEFIIDQRKEFDIVLLLHSIYYMDASTVLPKCYEIMTQQGCLVVQITGHRPLYSSITSFTKTLDPDSDAAQLAKNPHGGIDINKLEDIVKFNRWKYFLHTLKFHLDISDVFDENSINGSRLVEFYAHVVNLKDKIGQSRWNALLQSIKESHPGEEDGKIMTQMIDELIVIWKQ